MTSDFLLATGGIDNITGDRTTIIYSDNLNVPSNWFDNNISTTIQPNNNSSREFNLFGGGLGDDETLKKDFVFDRTDVRVIFIALYSLVFCCCFLGEYEKCKQTQIHFRIRDRRFRRQSITTQSFSFT